MAQEYGFTPQQVNDLTLFQFGFYMRKGKTSTTINSHEDIKRAGAVARAQLEENKSDG